MIAEGLRTALNEIRETSIENNTLYAKYVEEILPSTDIGSWSAPILEVPKVMNEFIPELVQKIVYTQTQVRLFKNPLAVLEGDTIPLGAIGEEIYVNAVVGRKFNVDDFAGLLAKYEADVKVQYHKVNSDIQYPVTITKAKIKDAFTSWSQLNDFIDGITSALYNGAYIDRYNMTKDLVVTAYDSGNVKTEIITDVTSEATGKAFIEKARSLFLNFQTPTDKYNAWADVGGYGNAIITWTPKEDIVMMVRNDVLASVDVNVLASAFNMDKTTFMGNVIGVNDFDIYENQKQEDGSIKRVKIYDGSAIVGILCDKRWFRIKQQDFEMDEFYNANNRTWQYYLNDVRMYSYSLFANAVVFATAEPTPPTPTTPTSVNFSLGNSFSVGQTGTSAVSYSPANADISTMTITSSDDSVFSVTQDTENKASFTYEALAEGTATLSVTCGEATDSLEVSVQSVMTGIEFSEESLSLERVESTTIQVLAIPSGEAISGLTITTSDGFLVNAIEDEDNHGTYNVYASGTTEGGTATLSVSYEEFSATLEVTVSVPALQSFTLDYDDVATPLEVAIGETETINVTPTPYNAVMLPDDFTGTASASAEGKATFTLVLDSIDGFITGISVEGVAEASGLTYTLTNNEDPSLTDTSYVDVVTPQI